MNSSEALEFLTCETCSFGFFKKNHAGNNKPLLNHTKTIQKIIQEYEDYYMHPCFDLSYLSEGLG
jgi:hypothetical protein